MNVHPTYAARESERLGGELRRLYSRTSDARIDRTRRWSSSIRGLLRISHVAMLLGLAACSEDKPLQHAQNTPPVVVSVAAAPDTVSPGDTTEVSCEATDEDRDPLAYAWSAPEGSFLGSSQNRPSIRWTAPMDMVGPISISVTVSDGETEATGSASIYVVGQAGDLSGTITDFTTAEAIEGALVSIAGKTNQSDSDGNYRIETIPIGNHALTITRDGYQPFETTYEVKNGANLRDVALQSLAATGRVFGVVENSLGAPLEGATCRIGERQSTTDASGSFSIEGVPHGTVTLQAVREGYQLFSRTDTLLASELRIDPVLEASRPGEPSAPVASWEGNTIHVEWAPPANDAIVAFQIYQRVDGGTTSELPKGPVPASQTSISLPGVLDSRYTYRISAINLDDEEGAVSDASNMIVLTPTSARVSIPSGPVILGNSPPAWPGGPWGTATHPGNPVSVASFEIEVTEVTNRQYRAFLYEARSLGTVLLVSEGIDAPGGQRLLNFNTSKIRYEEGNDAFVIATGFEEHPVVGVSWYGARAYALHHGLRLPFEAEWEKAARGTSDEHGTFGSSGVGYGTMYPWGSSAPSSTLANYGDVLGRTSVVTSHAAGASTYWGNAIYHLSGNVWEWCEDWYGIYTNPHQPPASGTNKVLRGGGYREGEEAIRVGARSSIVPTAWSTVSGFRCAR